MTKTNRGFYEQIARDRKQCGRLGGLLQLRASATPSPASLRTAGCAAPRSTESRARSCTGSTSAVPIRPNSTPPRPSSVRPARLANAPPKASDHSTDSKRPKPSSIPPPKPKHYDGPIVPPSLDVLSGANRLAPVNPARVEVSRIGLVSGATVLTLTGLVFGAIVGRTAGSARAEAATPVVAAYPQTPATQSRTFPTRVQVASLAPAPNKPEAVVAAARPADQSKPTPARAKRAARASGAAPRTPETALPAAPTEAATANEPAKANGEPVKAKAATATEPAKASDEPVKAKAASPEEPAAVTAPFDRAAAEAAP